MNCPNATEQLGAYIDGELPQEQRIALKEHVAGCPVCAAELEELRELAVRLTQSAESAAAAPDALWAAVRQRLDQPAVSRTGRPLNLRRLRFLHRPLAAAASLALLLGAGVFMAVWLGNPAGQVAEAGFVDYSVLLDGVSKDVDAAVARFLRHYNAERVDVAAAHASAPQLRFDIPSELPGGFKLEEAYRLRFGNMPGVAASYRRGDEPLFVFFHPPVNREILGVHRESHCDVAGRQGYRVEVGPWHLLHFTDPSTCHCLLSRLEAEPELLAVLAAISPDFDTHVDSR